MIRYFSIAKLRRNSVESPPHPADQEDTCGSAKLEAMQQAIRSEVGMLFENQQREFAIQFEKLHAAITRVDELQERLVREADARQEKANASTSSKSSRKHKSPSKSSEGLLPQVIRSQKMRAGAIDIANYLDFDLDLSVKQKPDPAPSSDIAQVLPSDVGFLDVLQSNNNS